MDEWKEGIWLAISALLTAVLITFAVVLGGISRSVAALQQDDINTVTSMEEYRKWIKYDNVIVRQADVISCILENRSKVPAVVVTKDAAADDPYAAFNFFNPNADFITGRTLNVQPPYYLWDGTNPPNDYTADSLYAYIQPGAAYRAKLHMDGNGVVLYIWFRRIT